MIPDDDASKSWSRVRIRWSRVESSSPALSRPVSECSYSASQRRRATHSPPRAPGRAHPGASRESPSRVYSEAARFLETASVPAGERGERGGQRGRTTDGTVTNDRRAKRATRRPTGPTSLPRRRTQARLERSGKARPRGTVAREYAPSRNPFLKRRGRVLRYLMRPVPVVRRPMAFVDQLSVSAAEGGRVSRRDSSRTRQIRGFAWPEGGVGIATRTVPLAGRGVAARAARGLLDVEGATTTPAMSRGRRARSRQSIASKTLNAFFG